MLLEFAVFICKIFNNVLGEYSAYNFKFAFENLSKRMGMVYSMLIKSQYLITQLPMYNM